MTRQSKTPRQRAEEALAVANRAVVRLDRTVDDLAIQLAGLRCEQTAAIARRDHHTHLDRRPRMTTTAKIASKGTKSTGITDDIAKRLHDQLGKTVVAVVEISSEARTENKAGDEQVKLVINTIEVAPTDITEDHLRELARSFHYERQLADGQPTLDGDDIEPKVADVLAAGQRFAPHPFLADDASKDNPICDVCGAIESSAVHADRSTLDDPFEVPADPADDSETDEPPAA